MAGYKSLEKIDVNGKKVLLRVDFNVPLKNNEVVDDTRIKAALPTIKYLIDNNAKQIILISHLGKPQKEIKKHKSLEEVRKKLSLKPVAKRFEELLGEKVAMMEDCVDITIPDKKFVFLENPRFHKAEQSKDEKEREEFAKKLASFADLYVNDAFGTCHRKQASVYDVAKFLPSAAGFLIKKEVDALTPFVNPGKNSVAILGGAKIEDKIAVVKSLLKKYDKVLLGGGMVFTFYKAEGYEIGDSLLNKDLLEESKTLLKNKKLFLPKGVVMSRILHKDKKLTEITKGDYEKPKEVDADKIKPGNMCLDIGEETVEEYKKIISKAKTIFWNGPVGLCEVEDFNKGTKGIAEAISNNKKAKKIAGGGDSVAVIKQGNYDIPISTGGGASLEFIQKGTLPCIEILKQNS